MGKYIFTQESFFIQGKLNEINEQVTSYFDCKHKHMMQIGAPSDRVLYRIFPIDFHGFTSRIDFYGSSLFGSWSYLNFLEKALVLLIKIIIKGQKRSDLDAILIIF